MKNNVILLKAQRNGDLMYIERKKGSNPNGEKSPMLKCPLCKKNLHTVFDASVKNNSFLFDVEDERYRYLLRDHVYKCARCHHTIGVHYLTVKERRRLGLPLEHECHEKIVLPKQLND